MVETAALSTMVETAALYPMVDTAAQSPMVETVASSTIELEILKGSCSNSTTCLVIKYAITHLAQIVSCWSIFGFGKKNQYFLVKK